MSIFTKNVNAEPKPNSNICINLKIKLQIVQKKLYFFIIKEKKD